MGEPARVFNVSKERASREVRDYLRGLRPALRLTQKELSKASEDLPAPISREFVANLETSGLPGTVRKFLSYAWLTGADLQLLAELTVAGSYEVEPGVSFESLMATCRQKVETGDHREALALARSAARDASTDEEVEPGKIGSLLIAASIAAKQGGFWRLQREFAEQALSDGSSPPETEARAVLLVAAALHALERRHLASRLLELLNEELLREDEQLASAVLSQKCLLSWHMCRFDDALQTIDSAIAINRKTDNAPMLALNLGIRSHILIESGRYDDARLTAEEALSVIDETDDRSGIRRSILNDAGRAFLYAGNLDAASTLLFEARALSLAAGHEFHLFESQVELCRLAHLRRQHAERDRLLRLLRLTIPRVNPDPIRRRDYQRLLDEVQQGEVA